jgi:hypothetical protein
MSFLPSVPAAGEVSRRSFQENEIFLQERRKKFMPERTVDIKILIKKVCVRSWN